MKPQQHPLHQMLEALPFAVLDGAMATELERLGADLNDPLWSARVLIEAPELIRRVHEAYLAAGADLLTTATYQASFKGFAQRGLSPQQAEGLFGASLELARSARSTFWSETGVHPGRVFPLVVASLGPYGAHLADGSEYRGDYTHNAEELMDWHRPQVAALAAMGGFDLLLFETIPSLREGEALVRLLGEFPGLAAGISFCCRDGAHTARGESFAEAVAAVAAAPQILTVGVNCTAPVFISPLLEASQGACEKPLMVYPNSGERWRGDRHVWYGPAHNASFFSLAKEWHARGARIIGGCCRTGPAQIRQIAGARRELVEAL